jgi:hypothetical protein
MAAPMTSLYVYYRIPARSVGRARAAAYRAAVLIETSVGERPRLMRRPETDQEGRQTWMEVYERWNPSWAKTVAQAIDESGLASLIEGGRHEEVFADLERPDTEVVPGPWKQPADLSSPPNS